LAQTQGDVAVKLAALLGLDSTSVDKAIAGLTAAGIVPAGGWNARAPATQAFIGALYGAVYSAIVAGKIAPHPTLRNAAAMVAAASTAAGVPSNIVVNAIASAGGPRDQASVGASYGVTLAEAPAVVAAPAPPGVGVPVYGVGGGPSGGGGGVATPSR
jgi:hypothetical protein